MEGHTFFFKLACTNSQGGVKWLRLTIFFLQFLWILLLHFLVSKYGVKSGDRFTPVGSDDLTYHH
jgi:hypothetical protein